MSVVALEMGGIKIAGVYRVSQSPGSAIMARRVTLMFTDVCDSTALFARLGDRAAFELLRAHFDGLDASVHRHCGELIKTNGDGILASFAAPVDGVRAALELQCLSHAMGWTRGAASHQLKIRVALHVGAVLAATLNGRLDYYGSTVNLGARLLKHVDGGEIVLSQELLRETGVTELVDAVPSRDERAIVKGFDAPVAFRCLSPSTPFRVVPISAD